jgi:hypothetical protein
LPLQNSLDTNIASTRATASFTRATTATFTDYQGQILDAQSNQARIEGNRVVRNLIPSAENMVGTRIYQNGAANISATQASFDGTTNGQVYYALGITDDGSGAGGRTFTFSVEIKLISGTISANEDILILFAGSAMASGSFVYVGDQISTEDSVRLSVTGSTDAAGSQVDAVVRCNAAVTLEITKWQLEEVTGNITHAPSEYVSTGVGTGSELVTNGTFDADSDWTDASTGTGTAVISGGNVTLVRVDGSNIGIRRTTISTVAGKDYAVSVETVSVTGGSARMYVGTSAGALDILNQTLSSSAGVDTFSFTAQGSTTHIELSGANNSETQVLDNISIKEADHGLNRDGVKAFPYHNGNTVASTGVVTEAQGPAINSSTSQWIELDGVAGTYVSTPDNASHPTGDATWIAYVAPEDWTPSSAMLVISKWDSVGGQYSFLARIESDGTLSLQLYGTGVGSTVKSTIATGFADGAGHWLRWTFDDSENTLQFYTSDAPIGTNPLAVSWTQLGNEVAYSSVGINDSTAPIDIGQNGSNGSEGFTGKISRALVIPSTDPTADPVVDFNANDYEAGVTWETQSQKAANGELLDEPNFDAEGSWVDASSGNAVYSGGQVTLTLTDSDVVGGIEQAITTVAGKEYRVSVNVASSTVNHRFGAGSLSNTTSLYNSGNISTTGDHVFTFTATGTTSYIVLYAADAGGTDTGVAVYNSASVIELPDLWTLNGTARAFSPLAKWADLPGSSGDYISTPDVDIGTTDLIAVWNGSLDDWTPSSNEALVSKWTGAGSQATFIFDVNSDGTLRFAVSSNGATGGATTGTASSDTATGFQNGSIHWARADYDASEAEVTFYISDDSPWTPYSEITWTQFGDPVAVTNSITSMFNSTAVIEVGSTQTGTGLVQSGTANRMAIFTTIGSTAAVPVVDFDARAFTPGVSTAVCPDGATYTVNGNVSIEQNIPAPWDASGPLGYLSEQAGTNLLTYSQDLSTNWTNVRSTDTQNYAVAPDGTKTANRLVDGGGTSGQTAYIVQALAAVSSGSNTVSVYAKADQTNWIMLYTENFDTTELTYFDVLNGTVGTSQHDSAICEPVGNGWFRCSVEFQTTTDLSGDFEIYLADADGDNAVAHAGSVSVLLWGAQVEAGSFPTTYTPTTTTSSTRNADVLTYSAVGNADSFPMTVSGEFYRLSEISATGTFLSVDDGTANEAMRMGVNSSDQHFVYMADGGVGQINNISGKEARAGIQFDMALAVATNDGEFYVDALSEFTDTSCTTPAVTTIHIGSNHLSAQQPYATTRNVKIHTKRLNDAQVATL